MRQLTVVYNRPRHQHECLPGPGCHLSAEEALPVITGGTDLPRTKVLRMDSVLGQEALCWSACAPTART